MRCRMLVVMVCACGRIDFDERADSGIPANAVTVTFGETGTATFSGVTRDTVLDSRVPANNFGLSTEIIVDMQHSIGLLRFDVSAIAPSATVVAASLRLRVGSDPTAGTLTIERMLEDWDEGNGMDSGSPNVGMPGVANYDERQPGVAWSAPGAAPPSRDPTPLGTARPALLDTAYDVALSPEVVGSWVADPTTNHGLALALDTTDGVTFRSSNSGQPARFPVLTVVYVP